LAVAHRQGAHAIADGTRLTALGVVAAWQRWEGGQVAETIIRQPGEDLPDRETLGYDDETQWEVGPGGDVADPWRNTRFVYLVDLNTAEAFTFVTTSSGGQRAVEDLGDQINRMRLIRRGVAAIVELSAAAMPTRFGPKSRPLFKVVGWETGVAEGEAQPAPAVRRLTPREVWEAEKRSRKDDLGGEDTVPFA
jgi:hypothetical protein